MVALVSANCSSRLRPHDAIDGAVIVPGASKPALHLYNRGIAIAISVIAVSVVSVRIISVIGIRIEERETKRVDKDKRSIVVKTVKRSLKNRCLPVMVLGAKCGAGRVIAGRDIIGEACMAADATVPVKLSAARPIKQNMRFVFIHN